jgi:RNA-directed DNA polymerase
MSPPTDQPLAPVPCGARQAREVPARWRWTEPVVWTTRMVTALEQGVTGGVWFSLVDKVYALPTLRAAFARVHANQGGVGVDQVTVTQYAAHLEENLTRLAAALRDGTYRPQAIRRVWIPKPGRRERRPLGIPTVRDRVVQTAIRLVLEPIFERDFAAHSYGFRPKRGCRDALRRVQALLDAGYTHVVDADLHRYFDSIPHDALLGRVRTKVADGRVLTLLEAFLHQAVLEPLGEWTPEDGTPQGAVISPLLANIYLDPLDHVMAAAGYEVVRYADDLVVLCRDATTATAALADLSAWVTAAGLQLHPEKTRLVDATQPGGFDFLGYHFEQGYRWPRKTSLRKLKATLRMKTPRTAGTSLAAIVADVNQTLRGWFAYFRHSHWTTFGPVDRWLRMRLRSVLRQRVGGRGRGRGADHQRWPNAFFTAQGLYSLQAAHARAVHSSRR